MNFYKHHLGDYAAATAHISWDEDMAFARLIRVYYQHERPIPSDIKEACRLARATTTAQRKAVEAVLKEFFTPCADGWHQKRCDEEIAKAKEQADTNRRIADEREQRKRSRQSPSSGERNDHESLNESCTNRSPATKGEREPSQTPDLEQELPLAIANGAGVHPIDPKAALWSEWKRISGDNGSLLGKLCRDHGDGAVLAALPKVFNERPADPKSFLRRLLAPNPGKAGRVDNFGYVLDASGNRTGERGAVI